MSTTSSPPRRGVTVPQALSPPREPTSPGRPRRRQASRTSISVHSGTSNNSSCSQSAESISVSAGNQSTEDILNIQQQAQTEAKTDTDEFLALDAFSKHSNPNPVPVMSSDSNSSDAPAAAPVGPGGVPPSSNSPPPPGIIVAPNPLRDDEAISIGSPSSISHSTSDAVSEVGNPFETESPASSPSPTSSPVRYGIQRPASTPPHRQAQQRTSPDESKANANRTGKTKGLSVNVSHVASRSLPSTPGRMSSPPSPHSPVANVDPNLDRIRRTSHTYDEKTEINALPTLRRGAMFRIYRNKDVSREYIGSEVVMSTSLSEPVMVRLLPTHDTLEYEEHESDGPAVKKSIPLRRIKEITRWVQPAERKDLGDLSRAALRIEYEVTVGKRQPAASDGETSVEAADGNPPAADDNLPAADGKVQRRYLTLIAPDEGCLLMWYQALMHLVDDLLPKSQSPSEDIFEININFKPVSKSFAHLIDAYMQAEGPDMSRARAASAMSAAEDHKQNEPSLYRFSTPDHDGQNRFEPEAKVEVLRILVTGNRFLKFGRRGSPHYRHIYIEPDLSAIRWESAFKMSRSTTIPLTSINRIVHGQETNVFATNNAPIELVPVSFSVVYAQNTRTLDLVAMNSNQYEVWTKGLQALIELRHQCNEVQWANIRKLTIPVHLSKKPTDYSHTLLGRWA
jgi:Pleckstrin homology domain